MRFVPADREDDRRLWAFSVGVAYITDANIEDLVFGGDFDRARGPAAGEVYSFTAARRLGVLEIELGDCTLRPELELPLTLEVVDENARSPFFDFNAAVVMRWSGFPWDDVIKTTFATGVGLSYSEHPYTVDVLRHPGDDRSNLKFHWPIELTFALPQHPDHQLMLYLTHQSGGRVFDRGGVNLLGLGYRHGF